VMNSSESRSECPILLHGSKIVNYLKRHKNVVVSWFNLVRVSGKDHQLDSAAEHVGEGRCDIVHVCVMSFVCVCFELFAKNKILQKIHQKIPFQTYICIQSL
jgi:hypothetical protein